VLRVRYLIACPSILLFASLASADPFPLARPKCPNNGNWTNPD
jgi:hypothetical protein